MKNTIYCFTEEATGEEVKATLLEQKSDVKMLLKYLKEVFDTFVEINEEELSFTFDQDARKYFFTQMMRKIAKNINESCLCDSDENFGYFGQNVNDLSKMRSILEQPFGVEVSISGSYLMSFTDFVNEYCSNQGGQTFFIEKVNVVSC